MYFTDIAEIEVATEQHSRFIFLEVLITPSLTLLSVSTTLLYVSCVIEN